MEEDKNRLQYNKIKETLARYISNIGKNPHRLAKIEEKENPIYATEFEEEIKNSLEIIEKFNEVFDLFLSLETFSKELGELKAKIYEKNESIYRFIAKIGDQGGYLESFNNGSIPPENKYQKFLSLIDKQNNDIDFLSSYYQTANTEIESLFQEDKELFLHSKYLLENQIDSFVLREEYKKNSEKFKDLTEKTKENQKVFEKISGDILLERQEIHKLKKDAIQLGLAQRYTQEKKNNNFAKWFWTILAGFGLCGLFFLSDLSNTISQNLNKTAQWGQNTQKQMQNPPQSLSDYALNFLKKSPAYLALVWFILFASRRRNEADRLASDYAHKEVFASSYEAYQEEIKKLEKENPNKKEELAELNIKLLDSMIGVLSDNPAKSLDTKKTTDELPAKELVNFASEVIKLKGK